MNTYPQPKAAAESIADPIIASLSAADQVWLSSFGVDPAWSNDPELVDDLNAIIAVGSAHLDESLPLDEYQSIIKAREDFMAFVGVPADTLASFRNTNPTIIPLTTFIGTQRVFSELKLDAVKIINANPLALGYAPESVQAKMHNLTDLNLDAVKIVNAFSSALGLALESVQAKMHNLTDLSLDAVKIVNAFPVTLGLAPESVQAKVHNLTNLGLDAVKVINANPTVIGYAPKSVRAKVQLFQRIAFTLRWEGSVQELIESSPILLGTSSKKLMLLGRIAAIHVKESDRFIEPSKIGARLFMPLEKYLLALGKLSEKDTDQASVSINKLHNLAYAQKINAPERKAKARELAVSGKLGQIGVKYLAYSKA